MNSKAGKIIVTILLSLFALTTIYPVVWLFLNSFKETSDIVTGNSFTFPTSFRIENYITALFDYNILRYFINSVIVTTLTMFLTLTVSFLLAYSLSRMKWRRSKAVYTYVTIGLLVPTQAIIVPIFLLIRALGLLDNFLSLILTVSAFNLAFATVIFYSVLRSIPFAMEESAVIDGCGIFRILTNIILPLVKPGIAAAGINLFLRSWNEFIFPLLFLTEEKLKTLPLGLLSFVGLYGTQYAEMFAAIAIVSLLPIIVFLFFNKHIEKAISAGEIMK